VIFEFFLTTGCRLDELASLNMEDINYENGFAKVFGKGHREAIVPLSKDLMRDLTVYIQRYRDPKMEQEKKLFLTETGDPLARIGVQIMVRRVLTDIGLEEKIGPHILRHTFATRYLRKGGSLEVLRKILRHRSITTTMIYTHLNNDDVRDDFTRTDAMSDIIKRKR
jgi:site-specific recombinase XerD